MKIKISSGFATAFAVFIVLFYVNTTMSQSHEEATPIEKSVTTQINCSKRAGGNEVYDATVTLLEVVRGNKAWKLIKKANKTNKKADKGYEYILARVSFKMIARGAPGDKTFDLVRPLQFTSFSEDFDEYEAPDIILPDPQLKRTVSAGQHAEGWIGLTVKKQDSKPLLMFDPSSGGAWSRGKISFFRFYK